MKSLQQHCQFIITTLVICGFMALGVHATQAPATAGKNLPTATNSVEAAKDDYNRTKYYGEPVYDASGKLQFVIENKSQTHSKDNYVWVHVRGIKKDAQARSRGRVRVAVWNNKDSYAKEGVNPFRASSHWAKDTINDVMIFKIGGFNPGESYSFFAHFDEQATGKVARNFLGIPKEQLVFTNAKNQGIGPGLKRQGLSAPKFENTLVKFIRPGQVIQLNL